MKKSKLILGILIFGLVVGIGVYKYAYQKHKNIETSNADFEIAAKDLALYFGEDTEKASEKYLNKVILVSGTISEADTESMTLNEAVLCYFTLGNVQKKQGLLKIKGRCIGYDELLEVVKLDQCSFEK
tara:strand:+ start:16030 stop:16413 length:384 start_codon:yes stop_codon:yes gene_type:complete